MDAADILVSTAFRQYKHRLTRDGDRITVYVRSKRPPYQAYESAKRALERYYSKPVVLDMVVER